MLEDILRQGFSALGLPLDDAALSRFRLYYERLEETNKVMNLTAITGQEDVARLHFLDCAALLTVTDMAGKRLLDVGSGAGFPGMVLKIACPSLDLTLLDSLDKRVRFLTGLCGELGFEDVTCLHSRAEEAPAELRESFDLVTSRAVARLNLLCELCLPFVKVGGRFLAMKGPEAEEELREAASAIRLLGAETEALIPYSLPGTDRCPCVVILRKVKATPARYPRRWGQIKKQPL